ncbi:multiprotein-bridging factor 1 [Sorochytrium milnesiophthora]
MNFSQNVGWDEQIVITKRSAPLRLDKSTSAVNAAMRSGASSLVVEKKQAPVNKAHSAATGDHRHAAKVDRETEDFHVEKVDMSVARAIQRARQEKEMTQKDLALKINEKASVITDYEASRAIPNQQILIKLERVLSVKLRGKDIGQPLAPRGSSAKTTKK